MVLVLACPARAEWLSETRSIMGTEVEVQLWAEDVLAGKNAQAAAFAEFERLDDMLNPWKPESLLSRVNREADQAPVAVTPELADIVMRAQRYSELSDGAFDISFAAVGQHYDYRSRSKPTDQQLEQLRQAVDYRSIELDAERKTIRFLRQGMAIDLGGIAKGYSVDRALAILLESGITSAVVAAGGDSRILGDLGDRPRMIGVRHPRKQGEYAAIIPLSDTAISTSGDYERFFEEDGVRYHHILNPATGRAAEGMQSATVIAPMALDSDALSTAVFVLGVQRGLALVNKLPGVDAILIDASGNLHYSADLLLNTTK